MNRPVQSLICSNKLTGNMGKQYAPNKKVWTAEMLNMLREEYPRTFTRELADRWNMGIRTVIRKARELGIEKEPDFLPARRKEIGQLAKKARRPNPTKGMKGWFVPGSEAHRFTPETYRPLSPEARAQAIAKRNAAIDRDRLRLKYGMKPLTKLKLDPFAQPKRKAMTAKAVTEDTEQVPMLIDHLHNEPAKDFTADEDQKRALKRAWEFYQQSR